MNGEGRYSRHTRLYSLRALRGEFSMHCVTQLIIKPLCFAAPNLFGFMFFAELNQLLAHRFADGRFVIGIQLIALCQFLIIVFG